MRRGEVWTVRLDPVEGTEQAGTRPAVIVADNHLPAMRRHVIIVPFTTRRPGRQLIFSEAAIPAGDGGLTVDSIALGNQVRTVSLDRLIRRRGELSAFGQAAVYAALLLAEGLSRPGT